MVVTSPPMSHPGVGASTQNCMGHSVVTICQMSAGSGPLHSHGAFPSGEVNSYNLGRIIPWRPLGDLNWSSGFFMSHRHIEETPNVRARVHF